MSELAELVELIKLDPRFRTGSGRMKTGALVQIVAAATSTLLFDFGTGETGWLVGLWVFNDATSDVFLSLGTVSAAVFTARSPQVGPNLASMGNTFHVLVPFFYETDIYIQSDAAAASPDEVEVQALVVVIG